MEKGLYHKYTITTPDGKPVDGFVLKPDTDKLARKALLLYAIETNNIQLQADILAWLATLAMEDAERT